LLLRNRKSGEGRRESEDDVRESREGRREKGKGEGRKEKGRRTTCISEYRLDILGRRSGALDSEEPDRRERVLDQCGLTLGRVRGEVNSGYDGHAGGKRGWRAGLEGSREGEFSQPERRRRSGMLCV
jgi:hypothetical protein